MIRLIRDAASAIVVALVTLVIRRARGRGLDR